MPHTILMIAPTSFFADYGNHIRIWQEARALQSIGHRVVIATYHNGDDMPGLEIHRSWDVPWIKRAMVGSSRHKLYLDAALSYRALAVGAAAAADDHPRAYPRGRADRRGAQARAARAADLRLPGQPDLGDDRPPLSERHRQPAVSGRCAAWSSWINHQADALITSSHNAAEMLQATSASRPSGCTP